MLFQEWDPGTYGVIWDREDLNYEIGKIWNQEEILGTKIYGDGRRLYCIWLLRKSKDWMWNPTYRDSRRPRSPLGRVREETKEEGEIQNSEGAKRVLQQQEESSTVPVIAPVMQQEQNAISTTLVEEEVNTKPTELENGQSMERVTASMENGLEPVKESVEIGNNNLDNEVRDLDDSGINMEGTEDLISGDEEFQNLTKGEMEDLDTLQEETGGIADEAPQPTETGDQELLVGNDDKKKGTRKALFKPPALVVGTSKKMFVQAVLSPRKKVQGKTGKRQGETIRKKEDKGPSNPKSTS